MDIVFITGDDKSGKSTLVRCLSGLGRGNHRHPSPRNVALLNWGAPKVAHNTLCLISSLNEGNHSLYSRIGTQPGPFGNQNTILPGDLDPILTAYQNQNNGCSKAILCISTSVRVAHWEFEDYKRLVTNRMIGHHTVSAVLGLGTANTNIPLVPYLPLPSALTNPPHPRNDIAEQARQFIGLQ